MTTVTTGYKAKTLTNGKRIKIDTFLNKLTTFTFDMLLHTDFQKVFPTASVLEKTIISDDEITIEIDDYIFSILRVNSDECAGVSVFKLNDTVAVAKEISVWLSEDICDFECMGTIVHANGKYSLVVTIEVE